jgi:quinol monooxygenase YgiN
MLILQIEHKVPNYEGWKKAFDSDPVGRKKSGVKRYQVYRQEDDPNNVIVDLYFANAEDAKAALAALQNLWKKVEGTVMVNAQTRILHLVETIDL